MRLSSLHQAELLQIILVKESREALKYMKMTFFIAI